MEAAENALDQLIVEFANEHGMTMPDIIVILIAAAVGLAFNTWKEHPDDATRIIEDTFKQRWTRPLGTCVGIDQMASPFSRPSGMSRGESSPTRVVVTLAPGLTRNMRS